MRVSFLPDHRRGTTLYGSEFGLVYANDWFLEARLEQVKNVKTAVEKLYAMLSEEQKKVADEIVLPMMGMGMGRGGSFGPGMMFR